VRIIINNYRLLFIIVFTTQIFINNGHSTMVNMKDKILNSKIIIGSDETLKGDTFGGLVVAGALFHVDELEELRSLGVGDSKQLKDSDVKDIAKLLLSKFENRFSVVDYNPRYYNDYYLNGGNVTGLLNEGHLKVANELMVINDYLVCNAGGSVTHVVDKYPGCVVGDVIESRADADYLVVGAASIVARYYGLKQFEALSSNCNTKLLLGSSNKNISSLLQLLFVDGDFVPFDYCKVSFRNVKSVLEGESL